MFGTALTALSLAAAVVWYPIRGLLRAGIAAGKSFVDLFKEKEERKGFLENFRSSAIDWMPTPHTPLGWFEKNEGFGIKLFEKENMQRHLAEQEQARKIEEDESTIADTQKVKDKRIKLIKFSEQVKVSGDYVYHNPQSLSGKILSLPLALINPESSGSEPIEFYQVHRWGKKLIEKIKNLGYDRNEGGNARAQREVKWAEHGKEMIEEDGSIDDESVDSQYREERGSEVYD